MTNTDWQSVLHERHLSLRQAHTVLGAYPWTNVLSEPVPPWLVPGLLQREALHVLSSGTGLGKSWLGLSLFLSGIYGTPTLDQLPQQPFSSIYLAADSPKWDIGQQLRKLMRGSGGLLPDPEPSSFLLPLGLLLNNPDHMRVLSDLVKAWDIDALFIDVMLYAHSCNENDNSEMANVVLRAAKQLRDNHGLAVVFLHHNAKPKLDGSEIFRGAGTIIQAAEHHHTLKRHRGQVELTIEKIRGDRILPRSIPFSLDTHLGGVRLLRATPLPVGPDPSVAVTTAPDEQPVTPPGPPSSPVMEWLAGGPLTIFDLTARSTARGQTKRSLTNALQYLRKKGLIQTDKKGTWSRA